MLAVTRGELKNADVRFSDGSACCVVIASRGYPVKYDSGFEITLPAPEPGREIYVAGAKRDGEKLVSSGGRVLGVAATGETLDEAIENAYAYADKVEFENGFCRRDIGARALAAGTGR